MTEPITAPTGTLPIIQALVQAIREALRASTGSTSAPDSVPYTVLSNRVFEGFAAYNVEYPFVVWQLIYDPYLYTWGSAMHQCGFDITVFAGNSVDARNIDQLLLNALQDSSLEIDGGQTTLICRRIADLASKDADQEGHPYYQIGGTYEVWTDQLLPR
jgi:hypothetical protein